MREAARIERIIALLASAWREHPEYRLGQLISNLLGPGPHDVFHVPDETWERLLTDESLAQGHGPAPAGGKP